MVSDITAGTFESYVEIENLLSDDVLTNNNLTTDKEILGNPYKKIKAKAKKKLPAILVALDENEFTDFSPLFDKISELFDL